MLSKENLEELLHTALRAGGDFAEIFIEDASVTSITCEDNNIEKIVSGLEVGAGIRVINDKETAYVASSNTSFATLRSAALQISESISAEKKKTDFENKIKNWTDIFFE